MYWISRKFGLCIIQPSSVSRIEETAIKDTAKRILSNVLEQRINTHKNIVLDVNDIQSYTYKCL